MLDVPVYKQSFTFFQYVGKALRAIATYFDGGTIPPPSTKAICQPYLRETEVSLLLAREKLEVAQHTVNLLEARVARLKGMQ